MHNLMCPKCQGSFYTAANDSNVHCPECGYEIKQGVERRKAVRTLTNKVCDILNGDVSIPARVVDVSRLGVGIKLTGYLPFNRDDIVTISCGEHNDKKKARIIWTKQFYGISRAGLEFL